MGRNRDLKCLECGDVVYVEEEGEDPVNFADLYGTKFQADGQEYVWVNPRDLPESTETTFEQNVRRVLNRAGDELVAKNEAYGNSALDPVRIFSKADRMEQLNIRLDDKISRVARGHEYPGDDTLKDIVGYATLILIARESE